MDLERISMRLVDPKNRSNFADRDGPLMRPSGRNATKVVILRACTACNTPDSTAASRMKRATKEEHDPGKVARQEETTAIDFGTPDGKQCRGTAGGQASVPVAMPQCRGPCVLCLAQVDEGRGPEPTSSPRVRILSIFNQIKLTRSGWLLGWW